MQYGRGGAQADRIKRNTIIVLPGISFCNTVWIFNHIT